MPVSPPDVILDATTFVFPPETIVRPSVMVRSEAASLSSALILVVSSDISPPKEDLVVLEYGHLFTMLHSHIPLHQGNIHFP
jgi:hypothetical protein